MGRILRLPRGGRVAAADGPPSGARSGDAWLAIGLGFVVAATGTLMARVAWDNYDAAIMGQLAMSIVNHHSLIVPIDPYHLNSPHASYGIGMSLLMIPSLVLARDLGSTQVSGEMLTNAWLLGLLTGVVFAWCRVRRITKKASGMVALLVALGAGLLPYTSTGFAEVGLAVAIAAGLLGLSITRAGGDWGAVLVGAATGAAVLMRDDSLLLVGPWMVGGVLWASGRRWSATLRLWLGALPCAVLWLWYNEARFGAPWRTGYANQLAFNHSFAAGLFGLVLSPGRGLLLYAPVTIIAVVGVRRAWNRDPMLTLVAGGLLIGRLLFYAPYWGWYGGGSFGPRYIVPAMPAIAVGLMEVIPAFRLGRRWWKGVLVGVSSLSIGVGLVGAAVDYEHNSLMTAVRQDPRIRIDMTTARSYLESLQSPSTEGAIDQHMFAWSTFPIVNEVESLVDRRNLASPALASPPSVGRISGAGCLFLLGVAASLFGLKKASGRDG